MQTLKQAVHLTRTEKSSHTAAQIKTVTDMVRDRAQPVLESTIHALYPHLDEAELEALVVACLTGGDGILTRTYSSIGSTDGEAHRAISRPSNY